MKLWSSDCVFNAPWKQTTEAVWKKYPNDEMPNVRHIDVLDRNVTPDGKLLTTRLIGSEFNFPQLITSILGLPSMCYAIEYSEVDIKAQKMTLQTLNSTFCSVLSVNEQLTYTPNIENPKETVLKQTAKVHINGIPFTDYFEDMIVSRFDSTSKNGRKALQKVLDILTIENIINRVTSELRQLSHEVDCTKCGIFKDVFCISEKMGELSKDLNQASSMINSEFRYYSNKFQAEVTQVLENLDSELSQISVKIGLLDAKGGELSLHGNELITSKIGLFDAVMKAGIALQ